MNQSIALGSSPPEPYSTPRFLHVRWNVNDMLLSTKTAVRDSQDGEVENKEQEQKGLLELHRLL